MLERKYIKYIRKCRLALGVIHKPRGQIFGYFDPLPPSWSLLLNKAYVIKWSFGQPPLPPQLSTWFMNDPINYADVGENKDMIDYQSNEKITDPNEPNIEVLGNELNEMEDDALIIKIDELQDKLNHLQKDIEKYLSEEFEGDTI